MPSSVQSFLAYAVAVVSAGELKFAANSNAATIIASCEKPEATTTSMYPRSIPQLVDGVYGGIIEVQTTNVKSDCVDYMDGVPCANHSAAYPPQYWCEWTGSHGSVITGPFSAINRPIIVDGFTVSNEIVVPCHTPEHEVTAAITDYEGLGDDEVLELNVMYGPSNTSATSLEYVGVAGMNVITMTGMLEPPPPASPPAPPVTPPPYCVEMHLTHTFQYTNNMNAGCNYNSWHYYRWKTYSSMTWSSCMDLASEYGVQMIPNVYTTYGWWAYRKNTQAGTYQGSYTYAYMRAITSPYTCVLGRLRSFEDNYDNPLNNTEYQLDDDGYLWAYQDLGVQFWDICNAESAKTGSNMISPWTMGKTTSSASYWLYTTHQCNYYPYVTSSGGWTYQSKSGSQRSTGSINCMLGYKTCYPDDRD